MGTKENAAAGGRGLETETTITFPRGLPGLEGCTRFKLFHAEEEGRMVYFLEASGDDHAGVRFTLVDPTVIGFNYELTLSDEEQQLLEAKSADEVAVFMMLFNAADLDPEAEPGRSLRANITGPLLINVRSRLGMQKVLRKVSYGVNLREG